MPDDLDFEPDEPDEFDVCHHGVGFDEECEDCNDEINADPELAELSELAEEDCNVA